MTAQMTLIHKILPLLLLFLLIGTTSGLRAQGGGGDEEPIAIVNGVEIPWLYYANERVNQLARLGVGPEDSTALDELAEDGVFLTVVDGELTLQEGARRGFDVSRDDAVELIIANPPPYIRSIFAGQAYKPSVLRGLIEEPKKIAPYIQDRSTPLKERIAQWEELTRSIVRYYRINETRRLLTDSLYAADPLTKEEIRARYIAQNTLLRGSVIRVLHSTIPESEVPVSRDEARVWYRENIDEYAIPESRRPMAIILKAYPSPADSVEQTRRIESARSRVESAPQARRGAIVDAMLEELPTNRIPAGEYISPFRFGPQIALDLAVAEEGDLLGPYPTDGESLMLYVADVRGATDTIVRARHILLNSEVVVSPESREKYTGEEIDNAILGLAADLIDSIKSEDDFARIAGLFSMDRSSSMSGGDVGYSPRGKFVPAFDEAVFSAPVGQLVGPVKTQFGYHLIWVSDRRARELSLRELRFPIAPSDSVINAVRNSAERFAARLEQGEPVADLVAEMRAEHPGVIVDSATFLKRLEAYADGLAVGEFLFGHEEGEVGVVRLPFDRFAVVQVAAVWRGGAPTFEEIEVYPTAHARRKKQLDILEERHADLAEEITPQTMLGPLREKAPMAEVFLLQQQTIVEMDDEDPRLLDQLVVEAEEGKVVGPVRGTHAIYLLRTKEKIAPVTSQIERDLPSFTEQMIRKEREDRFTALLEEARANAIVEDRRER